MANKRPKNVGEALLRAGSAGLGKMADTYGQAKQQEKTQNLQNFIAVMQFERDQRAFEAQNIENQLNLQKVQQGQHDARLIAGESKQIDIWEAKPQEFKDQYNNDMQGWLAYEKQQRDYDQSQAESLDWMNQLTGLGGPLEGMAGRISSVNPSTGSYSLFAEDTTATSRPTQYDKKRDRFVSSLSIIDPKLNTKLTQQYDLGNTPFTMRKSGNMNYTKAVNSNTKRGAWETGQATPENKAQAAFETGYSPEFKETRLSLKARLSQLYRGVEPNESVDIGLGKKNTYQENMQAIDDYFDNIKLETILWLNENPNDPNPVVVGEDLTGA